MTQYLGSPGFRCKETKESQLLQHSEVMGFGAPSYPAPGFLVKLGKQLLALGLIQGHKTPVIGFLAAVFQGLQTFVEDGLLLKRITVGHVDRHKLTDFGIFGTGSVSAG